MQLRIFFAWDKPFWKQNVLDLQSRKPLPLGKGSSHNVSNIKALLNKEEISKILKKYEIISLDENTIENLFSYKNRGNIRYTDTRVINLFEDL